MDVTSVGTTDFMRPRSLDSAGQWVCDHKSIDPFRRWFNVVRGDRLVMVGKAEWVILEVGTQIGTQRG